MGDNALAKAIFQKSHVIVMVVSCFLLSDYVRSYKTVKCSISRYCGGIIP